MTEPTLSIVIPTIHRAPLLAQCLESVQETVQVGHEVICVTIADDEDTQDLLASHPTVKNIIDPVRTGFVRAANHGFRASRGTFIVQLNDDCQLMPYAIENALHMLRARAHRDVGQLAFFHDSPVQRNIQQEIHVDGVRYVVCHVRGLCFANFGLSTRRLYESLGFYDEQFWMYGADPDFSLRIWHDAGLRVLPCPGALVRHHEWVDERSEDERAAQRDDNRKLFEKWDLSVPSDLAMTPSVVG
ncbi:MAG: glycosyltransferase [Planctomycetota bacterium]